MNIKKKLMIWLNTPASPDDWFFTRFRETKQKLFPCKHEWTNPYSKYHRLCAVCGLEQKYVYFRFGDIRTAWVDVPR